MTVVTEQKDENLRVDDGRRPVYIVLLEKYEREFTCYNYLMETRVAGSHWR